MASNTQKIMTTPGGNSPYVTPGGGQTPKFGPKKGRNIRIMQFRTLRQYQISKNSHLTRSVILFLQNKSQNSGG
mgnify:CR=1 FL=1